MTGKWDSITIPEKQEWTLYKFTMVYENPPELEKPNDNSTPLEEVELYKKNLEKIKYYKNFREIEDYVTANSLEMALDKINNYKWLYISIHGFPTYTRISKVVYVEKKDEWAKAVKKKYLKDKMADMNGRCYEEII